MRRRRARRRHLHAAGDGAALRRDAGARRRDRARRLRDHRPRQVPGHARRRALDHAAAGRRPRRASIPELSVLQIDAHADMRDCLHGHAAQPRLRDAPRARARADHPGRHPQPLDRGSRGAAAAEDDDLLRRRRCARTRMDRRRRRRRCGPDVYVTHRRGRHGPGDHAGRPGRRSRAGCRGTEITALLRAVAERRTHRRRRHRRAEPDSRHGGARASSAPS